MAVPSLVLGTAGHIDHGKSSLVKRLTGTDPDRLAEEKERGITIELGFAQLKLPSGRSVGVVDVPGHEKFIRQMVAGATGIDLVMLVVAADDGVMPQTREHLAIIELLGINRGLVALSKSDLVDKDWLDLVNADIAELLKGTGLEGAPIIPVSSRTGEGVPELLAAIDEVAANVEARVSDSTMRLPIDRVFTIVGAGTVVTGTMWSGTVARDDSVELYPSGKVGRVRGVQVHSASVDKAHAGQRVAVNITGIDKQDISRGDIVATPGALTVTDRFDARFTYLGKPGDETPFETGARVHVHHGTREVIGRVLLMDGRESLAPGESCFAQVRLEETLAPRYEDRFVVRSYSPVYTIGGGIVLDALPPRRTNLRPHEAELLEALLKRDLGAATVGLLVSRGLPATSEEVAATLGLPRAKVADELNRSDLARIKIAGKTAYIARDALEHHLSAIEHELLAFHDAHPLETAISLPALRDRVDRRISVPAFDALLSEAAEAGLASVDAGKVSHPKAAVSALAEESKARETLLALLRSQWLTPAFADELQVETGLDKNLARKVLGKLVTDGEVIRLSAELHFVTDAIADARGRVVAHLREHGQASAAELRDAMGVSRKYAIPLLEFFDSIGVTKREGDVRVLKPQRPQV